MTYPLGITNQSPKVLENKLASNDNGKGATLIKGAERSFDTLAKLLAFNVNIGDSVNTRGKNTSGDGLQASYIVAHIDTIRAMLSDPLYAPDGNDDHYFDGSTEKVARAVMTSEKRGFVVDNAGQNIAEQGALTVFQRTQCGVAGLDLFNFSGVDQTSGTHNALDGATSFVMHHYNDKTAIQLDYCGRDEGAGNAVMVMRMAYNAAASGHASAGTGYFQRFERTVKYDTGAIAPDNRTLMGMRQVDLQQIGLAGTETFAMLFHGRDNSLTDTIGQGTIEQPIVFHTYGLNSITGNASALFYSDTYGGDALKVQTRASSRGNAVKIIHQAAGKAAVVVDNAESGSSASFVSVRKSTGGDSKTHFEVQQEVNQSAGYAFKLTDSAGQLLLGFNMNGDRIFMRDRLDGTLRSFTIENGAMVVS